MTHMSRQWMAAASAGLALALMLGGAPASLAGQAPPTIDPRHAGLDHLLDLYVRDGFVYYRAVQSERGRLDRYVAGLDVAPATLERWSRDQQAAFWLNAYNALVLRTVAAHYPIRGRSAEFPANSIRQIPGAFEKAVHRVAGRAMSLDQIEKEVLTQFRDPRMFFAIGRGSVGGGRLRSEAFTAERLEEQLTAVARECVYRRGCATLEQGTDTIHASPVFSWREAEFVAAYAGAAGERYPGRSPIEQAIVAFIEPQLYPAEQAYLKENRFRIRYAPYDWRLNDLTGGMPAN
jgi:hypothetical protein